MAYQSFEELDVWKKSRKLKIEIKELTKTFPAIEKYRLTDQLIRSSRSICSQIAEGHGRRGSRDRLRFTFFARGSLSETLNHLIDAFDNEYITDEVLDSYRLKLSDLQQVMNGYIRYLESEVAKEESKKPRGKKGS
jgi:four helix bundle protein